MSRHIRFLSSSSSSSSPLSYSSSPSWWSWTGVSRMLKVAEAWTENILSLIIINKRKAFYQSKLNCVSVWVLKSCPFDPIVVIKTADFKNLALLTSFLRITSTTLWSMKNVALRFIQGSFFLKKKKKSHNVCSVCTCCFCIWITWIYIYSICICIRIIWIYECSKCEFVSVTFLENASKATQLSYLNFFLQYLSLWM